MHPKFEFWKNTRYRYKAWSRWMYSIKINIHTHQTGPTLFFGWTMCPSRMLATCFWLPISANHKCESKESTVVIGSQTCLRSFDWSNLLFQSTHSNVQVTQSSLHRGSVANAQRLSVLRDSCPHRKERATLWVGSTLSGSSMTWQHCASARFRVGSTVREGSLEALWCKHFNLNI